MLLSFPAAIITGIVGIVRDARKGLAIAVTAVAGLLTALPFLIQLCT